MQETQEMRVQYLGWEGPLEEEMATASSIPAWKSHGQRSLTGLKELDMNEHMIHSVECKRLWGK